MNKKSERLLLLIIVLFLLLCTACSSNSSKNAYICPAADSDQEDSGHFMASKFHYYLQNENQKFVLSLETWESGEFVSSVPIRTVEFDGGDDNEITLYADHGTYGTGVIFFVDEEGLEISPEGIPNMAYVWAVLQKGEFDEKFDKDKYDFSNGIILMCIAFSNADRGIMAISCSSLMEDNDLERISSYDFVYAIKATLSDES